MTINDLQKSLKEEQNEKYYPLKYAYETFTSQVTAQTTPDSLPHLLGLVEDDLTHDASIQWYNPAQTAEARRQGAQEMQRAWTSYVGVRKTHPFDVAHNLVRAIMLKDLVTVATQMVSLRKELNREIPDDAHAKAVVFTQGILTTYSNALAQLKAVLPKGSVRGGWGLESGRHEGVAR